MAEPSRPRFLESELFGHEKGAFTGAHERRIGRFEQAHGGTLFLDEIGELDSTLQVKLLRFLGERTFERVGSNKTLSADVRLITATHRDLKAMVREGRFRDDLYWRLCVIEVVVPPLRERRDDIPLLAAAFLREAAAANEKPVASISPEALEALQTYDWPGNVRELRAAIERAVVLSRGPTITLRDLPPDTRQPRPAGDSAPSSSGGTPSTALTLQEAEKQLIVQALRETGGNRTDAGRAAHWDQPSHSPSKTPRVSARRLLTHARLQELIHTLKLGAGVRYPRLAILLGIVTLTIVYDIWQFQNLRTEGSMDSTRSRAISPRAVASQPGTSARSAWAWSCAIVPTGIPS